mmetsp:Transcript_38318/g.109473  ORF Transcript_38318/g.109473 Transcript_38318/m.109473 type:complete len:200 (+) Transcript_38318:972-1571(+)
MAGLRLGRAPLPRLRLLRAAVRVGRAPHQARIRLRGRLDQRGDAGDARGHHQARAGLAIQEPVGGGEPGPLHAHEGGRVRRGQVRPEGQNRHGQRQHEHERPGDLPHFEAVAPPHGRQVVRLPDVRLRPRPVGQRREDHPLHLHPGVRAAPAPLRLAAGEAGHLPRQTDRIRQAQHDLHDDFQTEAAGAGPGGPCEWLG